jgi:hypothetical protein
MTTTWKIPPDWQGQTVAVLASGPNMSQEVADALREHRRIVDQSSAASVLPHDAATA